MAHATHIRIGGVRIDLQAGGSIGDAADLLEGVARINLRALRDDPRLRDEALRRMLSPPCETRCYVREGVQGSLSHDCNCTSGMQYSSDEEAQALEACPARDVWSDLRSLIIGHAGAQRGESDPIVCDCDDLAPADVACQAYLAWYAEPGYGYAYDGVEPEYMGLGFAREILGLWMPAQRVQIGSASPLPTGRDPDARFAIAITRPEGADIAHAYGLANRRPPAPQPAIGMVDDNGDRWWVRDAAAHFGMKRPRDSYYTNGQIVVHELRKNNLDGLRMRAA